MMRKRLLCAAALLLAMLCTLPLASCAGGDGGNPATSTDASGTDSVPTAAQTGDSSDTEPPNPGYPAADFNNYEFKIKTYVRDMHPFDYFGGSGNMTGDILGDSVFERNIEIENELGIRIVSESSSSYKSTASDLRTACAAGLYTYDAICVPVTTLTSLSIEGSFYDFNELPYLSLDQSWWDKTLNDTFSIGTHLYYASGDAVTVNNDATYIVRYNQDMASGQSLEPDFFYNLVRDGKWTVAKMMEIAANFSRDMDGGGTYDVNDQYGIAAVTTFTQALWYGCGLKLTDKDSDNLPVFVGYDQHTQSVFESIYGVFHTGNTTIHTNKNKIPGMSHAETADEMLVSGRALFQSTVLEAMIRTNDSSTRVGILPIPKYSEEQPGYSCIINPTAFCSAVALPTLMENPERTATVLECVMYKSEKMLRPAYFETVFQYKVLDDEASYDMLQIILDSRQAPDLVTIYGWGDMTKSIQNAAIGDNPSLASLYTSMSKVVENEIRKVREKLS